MWPIQVGSGHLGRPDVERDAAGNAAAGRCRRCHCCRSAARGGAATSNCRCGRVARCPWLLYKAVLDHGLEEVHVPYRSAAEGGRQPGGQREPAAGGSSSGVGRVVKGSSSEPMLGSASMQASMNPAASQAVSWIAMQACQHTHT
jgi:hypothetical protein